MARSVITGIAELPGDNDDLTVINSGIDGETVRSDSDGPTILADGTIIVEPGAVAGDAPAGNSPTGKRRGRKPGSRNRTTKANSTVDISGLENILLSCHAMLAGITRIEELSMEPEEASKLSAAGARVAAHYDMKASAKALDWTNLIFVVGEVYGSRIAAIRLRRMMEKSTTVEQAPNPVTTAAPKSQSSRTRKVTIPGIGEVEVPVN